MHQTLIITTTNPIIQLIGSNFEKLRLVGKIPTMQGNEIYNFLSEYKLLCWSDLIVARPPAVWNCFHKVL
jgi:hypothetical protein